MVNNLTATIIKDILMSKYQYRDGYACFPEFRTMTGWGSAHYVDFVAVGLWQKTQGIRAFEIKVSRGDFKSDAQKFETKHAHALSWCTEFYYICPWGLIDKTEVPELSGLSYINSSNSIMIQKQAPRRPIIAIPFSLFQAFAEKFGTKINISTPIRYLGKDVTSEEFEKLISDRLENENKYLFEREVEKQVSTRVADLKARSLRATKLMDEIKNISCGWIPPDWDIEKVEKEIIETVTIGCKAKRMALEMIHTANLILEHEK